MQKTEKHEAARLVDWAENKLFYWIELARLYDGYGLPLELIYWQCKAENFLPTVARKKITPEGQTEIVWEPVTLHEFGAAIKQCVDFLHAGVFERQGIAEAFKRFFDRSNSVRKQ